MLFCFEKRRIHKLTRFRYVDHYFTPSCSFLAMNTAVIITLPFLEIKSFHVANTSPTSKGILQVFYKGNIIVPLPIDDPLCFSTYCEMRIHCLKDSKEAMTTENCLRLVNEWHDFLFMHLEKKNKDIIQFDMDKVFKKYSRIQKTSSEDADDFGLCLASSVYFLLKMNAVVDSNKDGFFYVTLAAIDAFPRHYSIFANHKENCAQCGSASPMKRCASCCVYYCSRECQKTHWPLHRTLCCMLNKMTAK